MTRLEYGFEKFEKVLWGNHGTNEVVDLENLKRVLDNDNVQWDNHSTLLTWIT
jgi:hypothetical protein